jgi:hypothetical protein
MHKMFYMQDLAETIKTLASTNFLLHVFLNPVYRTRDNAFIPDHLSHYPRVLTTGGRISSVRHSRYPLTCGSILVLSSLASQTHLTSPHLTTPRPSLPIHFKKKQSSLQLLKSWSILINRKQSKSMSTLLEIRPPLDSSGLTFQKRLQ